VNRLLVVLALAGLAVIAAAASLVLFAHGFQPFGPAEKLGQVVTDAIWIATGLIAWQRRPGNLVGPLMMAVGFGDVAQQLYWHAALPFTLANLVAFLFLPISLQLFLAFPSGRLQTRFERRFVAFAWAVVVPSVVAAQMAWEPRTSRCPNCPRNLLLIEHHRSIWHAIAGVGEAVFIAMLVTLVVLLIRHLRRSSGATRRALVPVLAAAATAVLLFGAVLVVSAFGVETEGSVLLWFADIAYAAIPVAFLVGLLRIRLHRSAVADLVVELQSLPPPAQLRDAIAHTFGDPSLELAYWLPDGQRYVDAGGDAFDPDAKPGRAVTTLDHDGKRLAALVHDPDALLDEPELVEAVGAVASLALENARLQAELRAQLAEVRASRARIVAAGDAERRRLERDLHDGAQQRLLGIRLALQLARGQAGDRRAVEQLLAEADAEVVGALRELRALARGIHPAILSEGGLAPALGALARRVPVPITLRVCPERLPAPVEATAYFVAAEALANVAKHAHASSASIEVARSNGRVDVQVADNGIGGADANGTGLRGLRDRVEALSGRLELESPPGGGTRVSAAIPCA
jgi:signal transduction histidine kinase